MPDDRPSTHAAVGRLSEVADRLAQLAGELGHADVAEAIRDDARRRLHDGRVRVVVLGEIKHGKTSLINALLGSKLLPVGVTPTTGAVVAVRVDPEGDESVGREGTFLVDRSGARREVERERFEALARGKARDNAGDGAEDDGELTPELLVGPEQLPPTLELIDTPGFNDIDRFRAAVSRTELPRADVLVLVLDATQVLSRSELGLIRDAIAAVGGLDQSGARCKLVINRIDLVPEEERGRIVEHIQSELASVIPGELSPYLTNSKAALATPEADSEPVRAVARLRDDLFALAGRGAEILPARARAAMLRHAHLLGYNAAVQARALRLEQREIAEEIAAVEQAMTGRESDLAGLRRRIGEADARILEAFDERVLEFRADVEEAARAQIHKADINILTQVIPGAVQDAFLEFVHRESERLREELEQLTRELFATHGELARRRLVEATLPLSFRGPGIYVEPPAVLIEVGMVALGLVGTLLWYFGNAMTGMIMTIASPLTTVILREKTVRDAREQARQVLPGALDLAVAQLRETVQLVVERHGDALDEHLMLADRALGEQLRDALRRAEERLAAHESRLASLTKVEPESPDASSDAGASPDASSAPPPPPASAEPKPDPARLRERVAFAARAELDGLEHELEAIERELQVMTLEDAGGEPGEPETPPVIH